MVPKTLQNGLLTQSPLTRDNSPLPLPFSYRPRLDRIGTSEKSPLANAFRLTNYRHGDTRSGRQANGNGPLRIPERGQGAVI